jgi:hypothetical protein
MVLTAYFVISSVSRALLPPSQATMRKHRRPLDISVGISGPHDFAVRDRRLRLVRSSRPPHPALHVRDDRDTPLLDSEAGRPESVMLCLANREAKYFFSDDWTVDSALMALWKFDFWRNLIWRFRLVSRTRRGMK